MLYDIKNNKLKYWREFDELGDRNDFDFVKSPCACGFAGAKLVANTTRHRNQFEIVQCKNCGTLRFDPYLTKDSINKYYSDTYGKIKRNDAPAEKLWKKQAKASKLVFQIISPYVTRQSKILDFGGATGGKMNELLVQGYDVSLKDLDEKYYNYGIARGLKPFDANTKYDFIILARVLEHMAEPVEFLHEVSALLAPNGYIYIEVPFIENARDNYLLNEFHIAHKFYFTALSLAHVLNLAGLKPVHKSRNLFIVKKAETQKPSWLKRKNMRRMARQVLNRAALTNLKFVLGFKPKDRSKN